MKINKKFAFTKLTHHIIIPREVRRYFWAVPGQVTLFSVWIPPPKTREACDVIWQSTISTLLLLSWQLPLSSLLWFFTILSSCMLVEYINVSDILEEEDETEVVVVVLEVMVSIEWFTAIKTCGDAGGSCGCNTLDCAGGEDDGGDGDRNWLACKEENGMYSNSNGNSSASWNRFCADNTYTHKEYRCCKVMRWWRRKK